MGGHPEHTSEVAPDPDPPDAQTEIDPYNGKTRTRSCRLQKCLGKVTRGETAVHAVFTVLFPLTMAVQPVKN